MRTKMIMKFPRDLTNRCITYDLIKKFDLGLNILKAEINVKFEGYVVVDVQGHSKDLARGLAYLEHQGVVADLITNTIDIDHRLCVACGVCTGTCAVRALTLDRKTWALTYFEHRCVGCNRCVGVCPTRAIENTVW